MADAGAFDVKAQEAAQYLRAKVPTPTDHWYDLAGPAHAPMFAVAGATVVDLVSDIHNAITSALENGTTLSEFRKSWDEIVARHGWSYNGSRGWRTQLVYRANMASARAAGQWQKLWGNRERQPYLMYVAVLDNRTRPQHRSWHGTILPITDGFWSTHYPPNGWNCRCAVIGYGDRDLQRRNLQLSESPSVEYRDVTTGDGEIVDRVPTGIDPGWDHNVGRSWLGPELALGQKLAALPPSLAATLVDRTVTPAYLEAITERWQSWRQDIGRGEAQTDAQIAGFLGSRIVNALRGESQPLTSVTVIARDDVVQPTATSGAKPAWPEQWIDALPTLMGSYQTAMLDTRTGELVVVPAGQRRGGAIRVARIDLSAAHGNQRAAAVQSLEVVRAGELEVPRYVVLDGYPSGR